MNAPGMNILTSEMNTSEMNATGMKPLGMNRPRMKPPSDQSPIKYLLLIIVSASKNVEICDPLKPLRVQNTQTGYISSALAEEPIGLGTSHCPWIIEASPGQRINVTMYAFKWGGLPTRKGSGGLQSSHTSVATDYGPVRPGVCFEVAILTDAESRKLATVCGGDERETGVLLTKSHVLQIEITNPKLSKNIGAFLFKYQSKIFF